jgi:DNA polymerase-3 subunit alpha
VSSHFQLEKAAVKAGIKPIFGVEAYCGSVLEENDERRLVGPESNPRLLPARGQYKNHLTVIAKDQDGYRNLNRIVTQSYRDFFYHPTVSGSSLSENSSGIVVLSGCSGSLLACELLGGKGIPDKDKPDFDSACDVIYRFKALFGMDYYLEVQPFHELERTCIMNKAYQKLSKITDTAIVVTGDVHYPKPDDYEMQAILHAVHRGKASVDDAMREWNYEVLLTLPSSDKELAGKLEATGLSHANAYTAIDTSSCIADRCNVTLSKAERLRYPISEGDLQPWLFYILSVAPTGSIAHLNRTKGSTEEQEL